MSSQPQILDSSEIDAGPFASWLTDVRASLRGDAGSNVPCGDCVGCCVSSYFIPVRPEDTAARAVIPAELLVRAPGAPAGHELLGYREDGTCPMLSAGKCTIYQARPQTCRDYDCRIFAAAGIAAGTDEKSVINRRVRAWRFRYPTDQDRRAHRAVRDAADFVQNKASSFPGRVPTAPTGIAVLAVKVYGVFMEEVGERSEVDVARAIIKAARDFDAGRD